MSDEVHDTPIDAAAKSVLEKQGLRFDLLASTGPEFGPWYQAMTRGFYGPIADDEQIGTRVDAFTHRRMSGIYDDSLTDASTPVATASGWIADLSLPGEYTVPVWAISTITVAPTHRRRGIARQMMESELRTAVALGAPVAILTASEATIYERFGFAPAAMRADLTIDTARGKWVGPIPDGTVQLVTTAQGRDEGGLDILKRALPRTPGEMHFEGHLWTRLFGIPGRGDAKEMRVARYDDADGVPQGLVIYKVEDPGGHAPGIVNVQYLTTATDDAYNALWRYLLEMDIIGSVKAELRSVDEPVRWQIADFRAASVDAVGDHLWVRILDVTRALEARQYSAPGTFVLELDDTLGYAQGSWLLTVDDAGKGVVSESDHGNTPEDSYHLAMNVTELSKIYLGATSISTLVRAGRIVEKTPGAAIAADAAFRSSVTPWLSTWF